MLYCLSDAMCVFWANAVAVLHYNSSIFFFYLSLFQGHLLLIGVSGAGKTTLSRFVAWINGLSVFQIKVNYCCI